MRARVLLALLLLAASAARAEDDCGRMERTALRFRGIVRAIKVGAGYFTATIEIVSVNPQSPALTVGERKKFVIHSPAQTFIADHPVGKTFDLATVWVQCDDKFRRLDGLEPAFASELVEDFDRFLDAGHTYRAVAKGRELATRLKLPHHYGGGGLSFTNAAALLPDDQRERTVVFRIDRVKISQIAEWEWIAVYDATIVRVESSR